MNAIENRPECYGRMFPDLTRLRRKEPVEGQAFTALVVGSGTGAEGRSLEVKLEKWEKCVACPDYRTCYDLSRAKLELSNVLTNTMVANPWVGDCG